MGGSLAGVTSRAKINIRPRSNVEQRGPTSSTESGNNVKPFYNREKCMRSRSTYYTLCILHITYIISLDEDIQYKFKIFHECVFLFIWACHPLCHSLNREHASTFLINTRESNKGTLRTDPANGTHIALISSGKIRESFFLISPLRAERGPKQQFVTFYPAETHASPSRFPRQPYTGRRNWFRRDKCTGMYNDRRGLAIMRGKRRIAA